VSTQVQVFPLAQIQHLTLAQCIRAEQHIEPVAPLICLLTDTSLLLDSKCQSLVQAEACKEYAQAPDNNGEIELIVFEDITLDQLVRLVKTCALTISHLNAINQRNNAVSYRFAVKTEDANSARQQLASFALAEKLEAAITHRAPKLSEPGVLVMDMDSTTIEIECIDEIAALAGVGEQVAAVTELAMQGELDFAQSLHQRVATLENAPVGILAEVAKDIPLMTGLKPLLKELKKHDWRVAIASGGFTYFADHLKQELELDAAYANTLEIIDGKLTGKVQGEVVDAEVKAQSLDKLSKLFDIPIQQTVAMGDGANDLKMMAAAHLGVAYKAKPIVLKKADTAINFSGLDCLLHWLG